MEPGNVTSAPDGKALVAYFSVPETDSAENMNAEEENSTVVIDGEVLGNTQYVAYVIQENTEANLFRIEPVTAYPMDHAELEKVATEEKRQNARPEPSAQVEDMEQYDTIFLGYPNWYGDLPMILYSFLEQYDLAGKTIIPFVTSGASGFSGTIGTIQELQPDATVITDGLSITRAVVQDAEPEILIWLNGMGYAG
ncbi:flavodoxin [Butyricicoccus faecihominis]|uniref:flavodoxin n=1 Tax=Butyricicoccus faecihominis TaxID=1712515 RepID=UPI00247AB818|nr:flavodoxin [Butyricicoccus faecihominis]MCQ5128395.1 flavodoxin [Butyricicoccus faecihominis]